jgi:DNA-binding NarL/FixJ family response regulator
MMPVRILVADDHEVVRGGLRTLLESQPGWEVCGEAGTGREALQKAKQLKPDVIVLDITMPDLNGLQATRQILRAVPKAEVLILSMHESEQVVREVLDAGARGYVMKSDAARDLVAAVDVLGRHKPFFSAKVSELILRDFLDRHGESSTHDPHSAALTPREREIIQLLSEGKSNKEVAANLGISSKTVQVHRTNLMRKLGLHSLTDLVHYAIRNNIVQP